MLHISDGLTLMSFLHNLGLIYAVSSEDFEMCLLPELWEVLLWVVRPLR